MNKEEIKKRVKERQEQILRGSKLPYNDDVLIELAIRETLIEQDRDGDKIKELISNKARLKGKIKVLEEQIGEYEKRFLK